MEPVLPVSVILALPGFVIWLVILLLPWRPWSTRESLDAAPGQSSANTDRLTVLIPARNEADVINGTLQNIINQSPDVHIILVDDQSTDDTVTTAKKIGYSKLTIVNGKPLPDGWSGKLWALDQGLEKVTTEYLLLLDADIRLLPGIINQLLQKLEQENLDFVSLMAHLRMVTFWEKMLMPAFIFFFKLLYPFQLSNSKSKLIAAAAGGCILVKKEMLNKIGAFSSLRNALIDDCTLARKIKSAGGRTWIGLTKSAISTRSYDTLGSIWNMVARTAFTQLHYSLLLLVLCTLLMCVAFLLPFIFLYQPDTYTLTISAITLLLMFICYRPVQAYYNLPVYWLFCLPMAGILFLLMTWTSAFRHYFSTGASWKERNYSRE